MLTCFVCLKNINDPELLFRHIKEEHKICGNNCRVQCTLCGAISSNFSSFKKHVLSCFTDKKAVDDVEDTEIDPISYVYAVDTKILKFESKLREKVLKLVCSLSAKMNWPRQDVFTTIVEVDKLLMDEVILGIEELILPDVLPERQENVENFVKAIRSSIAEVKTEKKLEAALTKMDLIFPLTLCEISGEKKREKKTRRRKQRKGIEGIADTFATDGRTSKRKRNEKRSDEDDSESSCESDGIEGGETESHSVHNEANRERAVTEEEEIEIEKGTVTIMPIEFQIRKFLELPDVFEKMRRNTEKIMQGSKLDHFIKGRVWKEKLKRHKPDQVVVPFHFYGDGAQINNPLGPHAKSGEQQFNYYSFPTIPTEYVSRLENIFVAQIYPAKYHQHFSNESIYNNIVDMFEKLAEDGIALKINDETITVFFVLGLFIGDNKEENQRLGFVGNFSRANYSCRYCQMHIDNMRTSVISLPALRRNRENYDVDVAIGNETATGIKEYSIFNRIPLFHVTESSSVDLAHDLTEGILHTVFTKSISHFIDRKYFDLDCLNKRIRSMDFGEMEKGNIPVEITRDKLKSGTLKMSSSEMFFFTHHFTLIVGDLVPDEDPVWQLVLAAIKFFDLCYLPSYDEDDIVALQNSNEKLNQMLIDLFHVTLKPKSHISTHYDELTRDYGPLRYIQTIRFEGKHKTMKSYAKNTNSRINLGYSIAKKTQLNFAFRLLEGEGINDRINVPRYVPGFIQDKVYYSMLLQSVHLDQILETECFFATKIIVNGIIFSMELWLPSFDDENNKNINEIIDIVILEPNEISKIFVVCKTYNVDFVDHYLSYRVKMDTLQDNLSVINVSEFLSRHYYPVKIQNIKKDYLFRCKRF